jgi:hypothetical protein
MEEFKRTQSETTLSNGLFHKNLYGGLKRMNEGEMSKVAQKCAEIMEGLLDQIPEDELYRRPLAIEMINSTRIILKNLENDLLSIHRKYRDTFPYNGEELLEIKNRAGKLWEAAITK